LAKHLIQNNAVFDAVFDEEGRPGGCAVNPVNIHWSTQRSRRRLIDNRRRSGDRNIFRSPFR